MMNPAKDGLPPIEGYRGKSGEEVLLFMGIESATTYVRRGRRVSADAWNSYRKLIRYVEGLKEALDHREKMQGGKDD
jgi:hypothetical protein